MTIPEIIKKKGSARTRINYQDGWYKELNQLLKLNDLFPEKESLIEITLKEAKEIVRILLQKRIAFSVEMMSFKEASEYTNLLFSGINETECRCFTNGRWMDYKQSCSFGFNAFTDSTFDGGVLISSRDTNFCFWIEEED